MVVKSVVSFTCAPNIALQIERESKRLGISKSDYVNRYLRIPHRHGIEEDRPKIQVQDEDDNDEGSVKPKW